MTSIAIATPVLGGTVTDQYAHSLVATTTRLIATGRKFSMATNPYDSCLSRSRASLVAWFMTTGMQKLLFIDSDIEWKPEDVEKLADAHLPVVSGLYVKRQEDKDGRHNATFQVKKDVEPKIIDNGRYIEADLIPMGFVAIQRNVIEEMFESYPNSKYEEPTFSATQNSYCYHLFDPLLENGRLYGEDYGWSRKWRNLHGEIFVDLSVNLGHVGNAVFRPMTSS